MPNTPPQIGRLGALWLRLHSLRVVIALTVVVGVLLASFFSYLEQTSDLREQHIVQIRTEMDHLSTLTALALREPLWQFEAEQANSIMEAAFINPDVVSIAIWDDKGSPFATRTRDTVDANLVERVTRVVERNKTLVGKLELQMSTAGYVRKVNEVRMQYVRQGLEISFGALLESCIHITVLNGSFCLLRPENIPDTQPESSFPFHYLFGESGIHGTQSLYFKYAIYPGCPVKTTQFCAPGFGKPELIGDIE